MPPTRHRRRWGQLFASNGCRSSSRRLSSCRLAELSTGPLLLTLPEGLSAASAAKLRQVLARAMVLANLSAGRGAYSSQS